jgi:hypothetical protein
MIEPERPPTHPHDAQTDAIAEPRPRPGISLMGCRLPTMRRPARPPVNQPPISKPAAVAFPETYRLTCLTARPSRPALLARHCGTRRPGRHCHCGPFFPPIARPARPSRQPVIPELTTAAPPCDYPIDGSLPVRLAGSEERAANSGIAHWAVARLIRWRRPARPPVTSLPYQSRRPWPCPRNVLA